jgi:LmbE family N-acetylglucosaminyl deacetylase
VLTDGSKGSWDPDMNVASLVAQRRAEQQTAAEILGGGEVAFLGRTDGELRNTVAERREVARHIRLIRPDVVLGHDPWRRYRMQPEHRAAGFMMTDPIVAARDPHFFSDQDLPSHRPGALLLWEADEPNHVEDVKGHATTKTAALMAHGSQHESTMGIDRSSEADRDAFSRRVEHQLMEHGALAGLISGEAFHLITDI